jgi:hypothetical protein
LRSRRFLVLRVNLCPLRQRCCDLFFTHNGLKLCVWILFSLIRNLYILPF